MTKKHRNNKSKKQKNNNPDNSELDSYLEEFLLDPVNRSMFKSMLERTREYSEYDKFMFFIGVLGYEDKKLLRCLVINDEHIEQYRKAREGWIEPAKTTEKKADKKAKNNQTFAEETINSYEKSSQNATKSGYFSKKKKLYHEWSEYKAFYAQLEKQYRHKYDAICKLLIKEIASLKTERMHLSQAKDYYLQNSQFLAIRDPDIVALATHNYGRLDRGYDPNSLIEFWKLDQATRDAMVAQGDENITHLFSELATSSMNYYYELRDFEDNVEMGNESFTRLNTKLGVKKRYRDETQKLYANAKAEYAFAKYADEIREYIDKGHFYPSTKHWRNMERAEQQLDRKIRAATKQLREATKEAKAKEKSAKEALKGLKNKENSFSTDMDNVSEGMENMKPKSDKKAVNPSG